MHFKSITLRNFLSFGPEAEEIPLGKLNVLVGINGSGKSNLLEAFSVLKALPRDLGGVIREGGGAKNWIWRKGGGRFGEELAPYGCYITSEISDTEHLVENHWLNHEIILNDFENSIQVIHESLDLQYTEHDPEGNKILSPLNLYYNDGDRQVIFGNNGGEGKRTRLKLQESEIRASDSILAQRKDSSNYPELTKLAEFYAESIFIYRDWSSGRNTITRKFQSSDLRKTWLQPDFSNLFLVLSTLQQNFKVKKELIEALKGLNPDINDFGVTIDGSYLHAYVVEGETDIPAVRLSDGTLRYLCLLAILLHPNPPSVVCIEEPELGLHPDIIPQLAEHIKAASKRCQLIVTTHSDLLINCFTDQPNAVVVCERDEKGTHMQRLDAERLQPWLERYRLGQLWMTGELGGTRW